jgi:hypothetical protein
MVVVRKKTTDCTDLKTRSFPNVLAATRRGFAFYLANPISSVHGLREAPWSAATWRRFWGGNHEWTRIASPR